MNYQIKTLVDNVRLNRMTEDQKVLNLNLTFKESPYSVETIDALEQMHKKC